MDLRVKRKLFTQEKELNVQEYGTLQEVTNRVVRNYSINDFLNWRKYGELKLVPWFQRREVWHVKARAYLIDTILKNLPVPIIIIRESIEPKTGRTIREVVDGQQRLRSVFEFFDGKLKINKAHSEVLAGKSFKDLPENLQEKFRCYEFSVNVLQGANDPEVLDIFGRINSYTTTLNRQEKLNAQYHGEFKSFIYKLGKKHLSFFMDNKILSKRAVFRMGEAELLSELIIAMLSGLQEKKKTIENFYEKYDEDFPMEKEIESKFKKTLELVIKVLGSEIKETNFRRKALFYSLFLVFFDLKYGLPSQKPQIISISPKNYVPIKKRLELLSEIMDEEEPLSKDVDFIRACIQSTDVLKSRQIRHDRIEEEVVEAIKESQ